MCASLIVHGDSMAERWSHTGLEAWQAGAADHSLLRGYQRPGEHAQGVPAEGAGATTRGWQLCGNFEDPHSNLAATGATGGGKNLGVVVAGRPGGQMQPYRLAGVAPRCGNNTLQPFGE